MTFLISRIRAISRISSDLPDTALQYELIHKLNDVIFVYVSQRAKEDVLQKEVRVKILKDSINVLINKMPPGGPDLSAELSEVLKNYQKLCDRFKSKCHTLEVLMCAQIFCSEMCFQIKVYHLQDLFGL